MNMSEGHTAARVQRAGRLYLIRGRLLITYGHLRCTARTRRRQQCKLRAEDYDTRAFDPLVAVQVNGDGWAHARQVDDELAERYLMQRCEYHDSPDAADAALPEWESYESGKHPGHLLGFPRQAAAAALAREACRVQFHDTDDAANWSVPSAPPHDPALFALAMRDTRLTWRARGVLATLAAGFLPGHEPSQKDLGEHCNRDSLEALDAAIAELYSLGYATLNAAPSSDDVLLAPKLDAAQHAVLLRPPALGVAPSASVPSALTSYEARVRGDLAAIAERTRTQPPETYGS